MKILTALIRDAATVQLLLNQTGIDKDPKDNELNTPLSIACRQFDSPITKLLLEQDGVNHKYFKYQWDGPHYNHAAVTRA